MASLKSAIIKNRKKYIVTLMTAVAVVLLGMLVNKMFFTDNGPKKVKVGFVYDGDSATPYTNNFIRAQMELESELGDSVETLVRTNVSNTNAMATFNELIEKKCDIIFFNSYGFGEISKTVAANHPEVEFCQACCYNANQDPKLANYHNFMGEIYQGRYISGVVAGMKIKELIETGEISPSDTTVGYVGAFPYAEVISGFTAFFLGVRSQVPDATMKVKYTYSWSDYIVEKKYANDLIESGCTIISQHSDTIGPAVACENAKRDGKVVYHIGYNQSMIDVAPTTSITSSRINWNHYIIGAVKALLADEKIEESIAGNVHGNDISAGFEHDWVQIVELNDIIAADGTKEKINELISLFKAKKISVFKGNYTGTNPDNPTDTINLNTEYLENSTCSAPQFHYVLDNVIQVVK